MTRSSKGVARWAAARRQSPPQLEPHEAARSGRLRARAQGSSFAAKTDGMLLRAAQHPPARALGRDSAGSQKSYEKPRNSHAPLFDSSMTQTQGATLGLTTKIGYDRVSVRVTGDLNVWFRR